jgi:uncharacterized protein
MEEIFLSKRIEKILEEMDFSALGKKVAIKIHFGEQGCETYVNPKVVKKVYDKIISLGKNASLVECNVLYRGSRTNRKDHLETAREHGFGFAEIDILDGERGEEFLEADYKGGKAKLGKGLEKYDSMVVITHFKGHMMAGFGGALKNIGMGLGSRAGKLFMHSGIAPSINRNKCTACKTCIQNCNASAISIFEGKALIDKEKCEGCAMCIAVCPQDAVKIPWNGATRQQLQERIVDYAKAVINLFKNKIIYINVLENITEDCDCMGVNQKPICEDIGILAGTDIVAIDEASLDLTNKQSSNRFTEITGADETQLNYAAQKGLGEKKYKIIYLDY